MVFFGDKTIAWFDVWTFEHFFSGMATVLVIKFLCEKFLPEIYKNGSLPDKTKLVSLLLTFLAAVYLWEAFEFYMEAGYSNIPKVTSWFRGVEFWGNRLITDPIITTTGAMIGARNKRIALCARFISLTWLLAHVFIFPDCMYVQDLLDEKLYGANIAASGSR